MTVAQINAAIKDGKQITFCPFDDAWTNQAIAIVLEVGNERSVRYQVQGCESILNRKVSYRAWREIVGSASL